MYLQTHCWNPGLSECLEAIDSSLYLDYREDDAAYLLIIGLIELWIGIILTLNDNFSSLK